MPNEHLDPVYMNVLGVEILKQKSGVFSGSTDIESWSYNWNQQGRNFDIFVINYDEDEILKVIESIITQIT